MLNKLRLSGDFQVALLAKETPGFVGADLQVRLIVLLLFKLMLLTQTGID